MRGMNSWYHYAALLGPRLQLHSCPLPFSNHTVTYPLLGSHVAPATWQAVGTSSEKHPTLQSAP